LGWEERGIVTTRDLTCAIIAEVQANPDRTATELLQCAAKRHGNPWEHETNALLDIVRKTPTDAVVPHQQVLSSRPFLALCQAVQRQPKKDVHRHFSGNLDPLWICGTFRLDDSDRRKLLAAYRAGHFDEMKCSLDGLVQNLPHYLACFRHIVIEAFADGVAWVGIRFNPSNKPFCAMGDLLAALDQALQPIEADFCQRTGQSHKTAFVVSISRRYGTNHARAALAGAAQLLSDASVPESVKQRIVEFDLSGPELCGDDLQQWAPVFDIVRQMGLTPVAHLGDCSWPQADMTARQHVEYVRDTLQALRPQRIGHGLVLAPLAERAQGRLEDARSVEPLIRQVLGEEVQGRRLTIETAPSATIWGPHRDCHRIWYWDDLGVDWIPILDERFHPRALGMANLSTWVALLLLLAPEPARTPLTWARMMDKLAPGHALGFTASSAPPGFRG
jgi:adenosine deaminase